MKKLNFLFMVFAMVLVGVGVAHADIASTKYVDENKITVDKVLSVTSPNPVMNSAVTDALNDKVDKITTVDAEKDTMLVMDETGELLYVKPEAFYIKDGTAATAVVTGMEISGGSFNFKIQPFPTATASDAGISALGTIPSGAGKAGTATIWVE